ncbi:hypothetical protein VKT23_001481 [Stygiomarasmius scandens]|uniref:Uncharacterized protein n=1 Tax=Marasmiellus scandens TaxID=2682957 RepID=A0ABR1K1X2_9AGAR
MLPALFSCLTIAELQTALLPDLDHLVIGAYEMHESPLLPGLSSMLESRSMSSLGSNVNSLRTFDIEMYSGERDALQKLPSWPDFMSRVELLRKAGMIVHLDLQYPLGRVTSLRVNELEWSDDEY